MLTCSKCSQVRIGRILSLVCGLLALGPAAWAQVNMTTQHGDNSRTGANLQETILTPSNVNVKQFGKLFSVTVDGQIYAQSLYVSQVAVPDQGTHNVVYIATMNNSLYALDADTGKAYTGNYVAGSGRIEVYTSNGGSNQQWAFQTP